MSMRRASAWTGLILVVAIAFAVVLGPAWMIYPFRSQSQQGIELS